MQSDIEINRDLTLARLLLGGSLSRDQWDLPQQEYLEKNTPLEVEARAAIARLLRADQPLDRQLRNTLAELFHPQPDDFYPGAERRIVFQFRGRGNRNSNFRNSLITSKVYEKILAGQSVNSAVEATTDEVGLQREEIMKLWARHRKHLEIARGPYRIEHAAEAQQNSLLKCTN